MNRQKLTEFIHHPEQVSARDRNMLQEMVTQYPYATILRILLAKSTQQQAEGRTFLATAALFTPNRAVLRQVMENTLQGIAANIVQTTAPASLATQAAAAPEISAVPSPGIEPENPVDELPEPKADIFDELQKNLKRLREERLKHAAQSAEAEQHSSNASKETAGTSDSQKESAVLTGMPPTVQQLIEEHQQQTLENPKIQEQRSLIDSFLVNAPNLQRRQQLGTDTPAEVTDLSQQATATPLDLATETLAHIMEKQGKTDKAIDIYQKLILKYPGKSAYFANCIERLKKDL